MKKEDYHKSFPGKEIENGRMKMSLEILFSGI